VPLEGQSFETPQGTCFVKDFVISVNNIVLYISLAVIWLFALITLFTGGFLPALGVFVAGSLGWCIVSGFWFVQSATYEELRKLNASKD
jgi:hypothetical protein